MQMSHRANGTNSGVRSLIFAISNILICITLLKIIIERMFT
jgi:hypothetical protein